MFDQRRTVHMLLYPFKAVSAEQHLRSPVGESDDHLSCREEAQYGILHSQLGYSA